MPSIEQWSVNRGTTPEEVITSGHTYGIKNLDAGSYVVYGERKYGINLVWRTAFWRAMWFARQDPPGGPVRYGDRVALAFANGGEYVRYRERRYGINLVWSKTPVYEWQLTGGNTGSRIRYAQNKFGLFNRVAEDHVVHCERTFGINLRWEGDCHAFDPQPTEASVLVNCKIPLAGGSSSGWSFGTVTFTGQLTTPHGSTGVSTFNMSDQWEAPGTSTYGLAGISASGLRAGIWRIEARTPLWSTSCNMDLNAGVNEWVNFTEHVGGCARGFQYPQLAAPVELISLRQSEPEESPDTNQLPLDGLDSEGVSKSVISDSPGLQRPSVDSDVDPVERIGTPAEGE